MGSRPHPIPSVLYRHVFARECLAEAVEAASDELGVLGGLVVVAHLRHVVHAAQDARHALVHVLWATTNNHTRVSTSSLQRDG